MVQYMILRERCGIVETLDKELYLLSVFESMRLIKQCEGMMNSEELNNINSIFVEREAIKDGVYYHNIFYGCEGIPYTFKKIYKFTVIEITPVTIKGKMLVNKTSLMDVADNLHSALTQPEYTEEGIKRAYNILESMFPEV